MRTLLVVLALALLVGGCDSAQEALEEQFGTSIDDLRGRADDLLAQRQDLADTFDWCTGAAALAQAVVAGDVESARTEAAALREAAPPGLADDLRTIAEAAARAQIGDARVLMDDEVQEAALDVYAYAVDLCGLPGGEG